MNIYVGNLSPGITEEELRLEFESYGEVTYVVVMNDGGIGSGQSYTYGFVEMASKVAGVTAINNINGKSLKNRTLSAIEALPLSDKNKMASRKRGTTRKAVKEYEITAESRP